MRTKALATAVLAAAALSVQSPAVDAQVQGAGSAGIHMQLQEMQYEIRELRGMVEELSHEVRRLRQRQIDDYQDLDSRLSGMPADSPAPRAATPAPAPPAVVDPLLEAARTGSGAGQTTPPPAADGAAAEREMDSYNTAYELLGNRQIEESIEAFKAHLQRYPDGRYAPNAHYWLGEIYLLQNDLSAAEEAFSTVVNDFADDRKAPDAMFKLGRVYHLQGREGQARQMMNRVATTDSSAAALARAYLQENF